MEIPKQTKLILSIIGVAAIIVPATLLVVLSQKTPPEPDVSSGSRQIDTQTIKDAVDRMPKQQIPTPFPSTPSAIPTFEGSPSGR